MPTGIARQRTVPVHFCALPTGHNRISFHSCRCCSNRYFFNILSARRSHVSDPFRVTSRFAPGLHYLPGTLRISLLAFRSLTVKPPVLQRFIFIDDHADTAPIRLILQAFFQPGTLRTELLMFHSLTLRPPAFVQSSPNKDHCGLVDIRALQPGYFNAGYPQGPHCLLLLRTPVPIVSTSKQIQTLVRIFRVFVPADAIKRCSVHLLDIHGRISTGCTLATTAATTSRRFLLQ